MPVTIRKPINAEPLKPAITEKSKTRRESLKAVLIAQDLAPEEGAPLLPDLDIEMVPIDALTMPSRRVRKTAPSDIKEVENSLKEFGLSAPILIDKDNRIIDGVHIVRAATNLGAAKLPCVRVTHLSVIKVRALRIALNRIGSKRCYDLGELRFELEEIKIEGISIDNLGFSSLELSSILLPDPELERVDGEPDEYDDIVPVTKLGDLWKLGPHLLLCGDAKAADSYAKLMQEGERAQLALTDPPYGVAVSNVVSTKHPDFIEGGSGTTPEGFKTIISEAFTNIEERLVPGGLLLSFMDGKHLSPLIDIGEDLGLELINVITWVKAQGGMGSLWRSRSEFIAALKKKGKHKNNINLGKHGRDRTNVWEVAGAGTKGTDAQKMLRFHPTPKPVQMLADAILDVTDRGDIVLDPFGGSGSTLIAAEQTERVARLIELNPAYCDLIIRRWQKETGKHATLVASSDRFAAVEAEVLGMKGEKADG